MLALDDEPAVLGISAAWSIGEASGVALWQLRNRTWRCLRVAPSYAGFCGEIVWDGELAGGHADVDALLQTCRRLLGGALPTVVAANVPLARKPVEDRRACDRLLNQHFARRGCSIPRPSSRSPGPLGLRFYQAFRAAGFRLVTGSRVHAHSSLIEVNADVALLALMGRRHGLRYKALQTGRYWPGLSAGTRARLLVQQWRSILWRLGKYATGIDVPLPESPEQWPFVRLKRFQNAIEALACAWMSTEFVAGTLRPVGDDKAAIWIPQAAMPRASAAK